MLYVGSVDVLANGLTYFAFGITNLVLAGGTTTKARYIGADSRVVAGYMRYVHPIGHVLRKIETEIKTTYRHLMLADPTLSPFKYKKGTTGEILVGCHHELLEIRSKVIEMLNTVEAKKAINDQEVLEFYRIWQKDPSIIDRGVVLTTPGGNDFLFSHLSELSRLISVDRGGLSKLLTSSKVGVYGKLAGCRVRTACAEDILGSLGFRMVEANAHV